MAKAVEAPALAPVQEQVFDFRAACRSLAHKGADLDRLLDEEAVLRELAAEQAGSEPAVCLQLVRANDPSPARPLLSVPLNTLPDAGAQVIAEAIRSNNETIVAVVGNLSESSQDLYARLREMLKKVGGA